MQVGKRSEKTRQALEEMRERQLQTEMFCFYVRFEAVRTIKCYGQILVITNKIKGCLLASPGVTSCIHRCAEPQLKSSVLSDALCCVCAHSQHSASSTRSTADCMFRLTSLLTRSTLSPMRSTRRPYAPSCAVNRPTPALFRHAAAGR